MNMATMNMATSDQPDASKQRRTSKQRWFLRGLAVGLLLTASVNAVSYFFRSSDWSGLIGRPQSMNSAIGFPWVVWEAGNHYGGLFADYPNMGKNIVFAMLVGAAIGAIAVWQSDFLDGAIHEVEVQDVDGSSSADAVPRKPAPVQFSLRGLMITTTIAAIASTVVSRLAVHPMTLVAIYALGPVALVGLAMVPHRWNWQRRVVLLVPITLGLIGVAMAVGHALAMEFDQVLMGIFLSWTPQSAVAASGLTTLLLWTASRRQIDHPIMPGDAI
ncbi:hypothetical protein Poly51_04820 [Rubripirellula tenax]|uniref:Uncharacterized protein n=1 Tax=Rubripirellula tenax TaxID=2528015 RepID=A0A5C6FJD5_9BACT|nr:hypothetical protein [Rubripirellula tenax]TWU60207.1 hypothetical protein Poly51_04820 [Rubripirellula tenax]